jgi:hypothetical protein
LNLTAINQKKERKQKTITQTTIAQKKELGEDQPPPVLPKETKNSTAQKAENETKNQIEKREALL